MYLPEYRNQKFLVMQAETNLTAVLRMRKQMMEKDAGKKGVFRKERLWVYE